MYRAPSAQPSNSGQPFNKWLHEGRQNWRRGPAHKTARTDGFGHVARSAWERVVECAHLSSRRQRAVRLRSTPTPTQSHMRAPPGSLHEYMGHDVSNMRGFDSYRLLTLSLAALMTRISSAMIEAAHTSAGVATLARTVPFWGRFRSPRDREPRKRGRAAGAYCRVPQTLRRPAITYRLSCVMVGMSKRHHLGSCDLKTPRAACLVLTSTDARDDHTV